MTIILPKRPDGKKDYHPIAGVTYWGDFEGEYENVERLLRSLGLETLSLDAKDIQLGRDKEDSQYPMLTYRGLWNAKLLPASERLYDSVSVNRICVSKCDDTISLWYNENIATEEDYKIDTMGVVAEIIYGVVIGSVKKITMSAMDKDIVVPWEKPSWERSIPIAGDIELIARRREVCYVNSDLKTNLEVPFNVGRNIIVPQERIWI